MEFSNNNPQNKSLAEIREEAYKQGYYKAEKENEDSFFKLVGVMHFVDKWLDGDELKLNEVQRADRMREKTLQIVEDLQKKAREAYTQGYNDALATPKMHKCGGTWMYCNGVCHKCPNAGYKATNKTD